MSPPDDEPTRLETVGNVRRMLAPMLGVRPDQVGHYAMVIECENGVHLKFCCDDRQLTASILREGARLLLSQVGESNNERPPPPMPES